MATDAPSTTTAERISVCARCGDETETYIWTSKPSTRLDKVLASHWMGYLERNHRADFIELDPGANGLPGLGYVGALTYRVEVNGTTYIEGELYETGMTLADAGLTPDTVLHLVPVPHS